MTNPYEGIARDILIDMVVEAREKADKAQESLAAERARADAMAEVLGELMHRIKLDSWAQHGNPNEMTMRQRIAAKTRKALAAHEERRR